MWLPPNLILIGFLFVLEHRFSWILAGRLEHRAMMRAVDTASQKHPGDSELAKSN